MMILSMFWPAPEHNLLTAAHLLQPHYVAVVVVVVALAVEPQYFTQLLHNLDLRPQRVRWNMGTIL
jgi:hypothetical protein